MARSLTEDEYMQGQPPEENDLPSTFLSEEDIADSTNVIMIPNYKPNVDLILDNYVEQIIKVRNKTHLKETLMTIWDHASFHGAISERLDKLQADIEDLEIDMLSMAGYEIDFVQEDQN